MLPPVKQEERGTHHMESTLADRGTQVGCLDPVVVDFAKASGQRHVVVRIKGEWMFTHKRWRPRSRTPTVWQPFPSTDGSRNRRRASLETTWAWMRTPTLCCQTSCTPRRCAGSASSSKAPREWTNLRHRAHGRPGSNSPRPQLAYKHRPCEGNGPSRKGPPESALANGANFSIMVGSAQGAVPRFWALARCELVLYCAEGDATRGHKTMSKSTNWLPFSPWTPH